MSVISQLDLGGTEFASIVIRQAADHRLEVQSWHLGHNEIGLLERVWVIRASVWIMPIERLGVNDDSSRNLRVSIPRQDCLELKDHLR